MIKTRRSPYVTAKMASAIKWMLARTTLAQHQIAARFNINQGRVSEISTGKRFRNEPEINPSDLGLTL